MPLISANYSRALILAEELHRDQRRKGKDVPYISHLMAVSALVWEDGGDEEEAIAALLHDAIEDARVSREQIAERFGAW
jgi:(p)ppGpp synthase/HD superfamily hydrolase